MANRVTGAEVVAIMDTELTATEVEPFITPANLIVTSKLADQNLGDEMLTEIEKYLSAHFASVKSPPVKSETAGKGSQTYNVGQVGKGLDASTYGQYVKILDPTGIISNLGKTGAMLKVDDFREAV